MRFKNILKAIASGLIWGLGQLFNKQFIKAVFFFVFFALFLAIEFGTGHYFHKVDPYDSITIAKKFEQGNYEKFIDWYNMEYQDYLKTEESAYRDQMMFEGKSYEQIIKEQGKSFDEYLKENNINKKNFTSDDFVSFLAYNIKFNSMPVYTNVNDKSINILETDENVKDFKKVTAVGRYYYIDEKVYELTSKIYVDKETGENISKDSLINIKDETDFFPVENFNKDPKYAGSYLLDYNNMLFFNEDKSVVYVQVKRTEKVLENNEYKENNTVIYVPINELLNHDISNKLDNNNKLKSVNSLIKYTLVTKDNAFYDYYNPLINNYKSTLFSKFVTNYFNQYVYGDFNTTYQGADYARLLLRVYLKMNPAELKYFEDNYSNFFSKRAGFFLKGLWGIVTLGEVRTNNYNQTKLLSTALYPSSFEYEDNIKAVNVQNITVEGDTSEYVLLRGLISTLLLCYFIIVYVWNIIDAYKTSKKQALTKVREKDIVWFKAVYDNAFEYIVLLPAIFVLTFITIMPILYGFLVAFTSYSGYSSDSVGALVDWVGFKNFASIFSFGNEASLPFAETFWKVLVWTAIWAIFSTVTVFFGGFFQAIIINSDRVPFKKFWRTILILPWAVPAIISQMVFSIIFNENGIINAIFKRAGIYDILIKWGMLGKPLSSNASFFEKLTFLGRDNIQWFTNPSNPTFVRIVIIIVNIWLGFPYYMALMSGVMTSIDKSLYEAAEIDGATKGQKFKFITFPLVLFSTAPLLVMCFSGNFNNFGIIYFMTSGGANKTLANAFAGDTDILISWMYTLTVDNKIYNMASVFSILIFILVGSISAWNYSRTKSFKEDM